MTPRYVIHVGPLKTASTYLQQCLTATRPELARQGICYPEEFLAKSNKFMHMPVYRALRRDNVGALRDGFARINETGYGTVVLSCEHFIFLNTDLLRVLRDVTGAQEISFVYACRRWSDRLGSLWNQSLFMGGRGNFPEFYLGLLGSIAGLNPADVTKRANTRADIDYSLYWDDVSRNFGRENLSIFPYSTIMDNGDDVFVRFCQDVLGLTDAPTTPLAGSRRWASPPAEDQEILRVLNDMHWQRVGKSDTRIRGHFLRRRKHLDTGLLSAAIGASMREIVVDDHAAHFDDTYERMSSFTDRVVGGGPVFARKAKIMRYASPSYLLEDGVQDALKHLYARIAAAF